MIPDGASVMIGGFMAVGTPERVIDEIVRQNKRDLTAKAPTTTAPRPRVGRKDSRASRRAMVLRGRKSRLSSAELHRRRARPHSKPSASRATGGRFVESRRATNGFHTRSDARAPIDACGPSKSLILPELCRTHLGLLDARAEFEPGILVLLQCGALRRPALPGMQSREHEPKRLQGPRCEMQHKRQRHFAFVLRRWLTWFYPQVCQNQ